MSHIDLSSQWLHALAKDADIAIPEHILTLLELLEPMNSLAVQDFGSRADYIYKADNTPASKPISRLKHF